MVQSPLKPLRFRCGEPEARGEAGGVDRVLSGLKRRPGLKRGRRGAQGDAVAVGFLPEGGVRVTLWS